MISDMGRGLDVRGILRVSIECVLTAAPIRRNRFALSRVPASLAKTDFSLDGGRK